VWLEHSAVTVDAAGACLALEVLDQAESPGGCVFPVIVGVNQCGAMLVVDGAVFSDGLPKEFPPGAQIMIETDPSNREFVSSTESTSEWALPARVGDEDIVIAFRTW
jgi:hypothetical protein